MSFSPCCVLFDLDGTLADTAPDLANALNRTLLANSRQPLDYEDIRPSVSRGGVAMIELGFQVGESDPAFAGLRQEFLDYYHRNIAEHTRLFTHMDTVLGEIETRGIRWGIVTNKPGWLTEPLLQQLDLDSRCSCIVSGDTLPVSKPHPDPLLHACKQLGCPVDSALFVGDALRDIEAGHAAGIQTLVAAWGYIGKDEDPHTWGADGILAAPLQLLDWLGTAR